MQNHNQNYDTIVGTQGDDILSNTPNSSPPTTLGTSVSGFDGDDVLNLTAVDGDYFETQIHAYGQGGDDVLNLGFGSVDGQTAGHHVWGDYYDRLGEKAPRGRDTFNFTDFDDVDGLVTGRIDDFDPSSDTLQINGVDLDLNRLPDGVRVVAYNGDHSNSEFPPQRYLLMDIKKLSDTGDGYLFYALDGARIDPDLQGAPPSLKQEVHFIDIEAGDLEAFFAGLPDVAFTDHENYVPVGLSPEGGEVINDIDLAVEDLNRVVSGTDEGDLIAAGLNGDTVQAGGGDDRVWGGSGDDVIRGEGGDDTLAGGVGADILTGGGGADRFAYSRGEGADVITDFTPGLDRIDLSEDGEAGFGDLTGRMTSTAEGVVIDFGGGAVLTLRGVDADALTAGDFVFAEGGETVEPAPPVEPTPETEPAPEPEAELGGATGEVRDAVPEDVGPGVRRFSFEAEDEGVQVVRNFDLRSSSREKTWDVLSVEIDGEMQDASSEVDFLGLVRRYENDGNDMTNAFVDEDKDEDKDYVAFAHEDGAFIITNVARSIGIDALQDSGAELLA